MISVPRHLQFSVGQWSSSRDILAVSDIECQTGLLPCFAWKPPLPPAPMEGCAKSAAAQADYQPCERLQ
eukprot:3114671-Pyramimonas_sp.AAC.1